MWTCGPYCAEIGKSLGRSLGSGFSHPLGALSVWVYDNILDMFVKTIVNWIDSDDGIGHKLLEMGAKHILDEIVKKADQYVRDPKYLHSKMITKSNSYQWRNYIQKFLARAPPAPTGSNSFVFTYVFTEKCLCRRLAPPPTRVGAPQWEILDPPLHILLDK